MDKNNAEVFKEEVSWFFKPADTLELSETKFHCPDSFITTFPTLYKLISLATVLDITLKGKNDTNKYKLFSWTYPGGFKCGWLCKFETSDNKIEVLNDHQLLVDNIGGIKETYNQPETGNEMLTDNQNFIFTKSECRKGLGDWTELYDQACSDEDAKKIETKDLVCFAGEANGNETFYDLKTKQVLLFASDHSFDNVEVLEGQPEYTFYTINGVTNFVDYAETLAQQWLDIIVKDN